MKAYWVTGLSNPDSVGHYCGTLGEAHALGKEEQDEVHGIRGEGGPGGEDDGDDEREQRDQLGVGGQSVDQ